MRRCRFVYLWHPENFLGCFFVNEKYMLYAIELAKKGIGFVNPNPLVGAVIVKNGRIIGEGFHERYGDFHAERNALASCGESAADADMYVTLEPCSHHGNQPPCCEAVAAAGIKNVYIGSSDPNPLVSGKGIEYLRNKGVNVVENVLKEECDAINNIFFHYITNKRPYVIMKAAMSIDGRTASYTGDSKWITNEMSRKDVHNTRKQVAAIMVGVNTVIADDPMLDCRMEKPSNPIRIICDSSLRIPISSKIMRTAKSIPTIIATVSDDEEKIENLKELGADIIVTKGGKVNLNSLMLELGKRKVDSVLVEGGATLHASMLENHLVDLLQVYIAPKIIGGVDAKPVVAGKGVELVKNAYIFKSPKIKTFGDDVMIEYRR